MTKMLRLGVPRARSEKMMTTTTKRTQYLLAEDTWYTVYASLAVLNENLLVKDALTRE